MKTTLPKVTVHLPHLRENVRTLIEYCNRHQIQPTGVTKVVGGDPVIAKILVEEGLTSLGDSRVENLRRMAGISAEKWLIRPPMLSELEDLVQYGDVSLQSELAVLQALEAVCAQGKKRHKVILMVDLGDLREGFVEQEELLQVAEAVEAMKWVELYGIGTNLTCFSFIVPSEEKMELLVTWSRSVEERIGRPLAVVSGGNSATIDLMLTGGIPAGVNNLRLGESILFGKERRHFQFLENTHQDVFRLSCEICELKEKPSLPWGEIGRDSYGNSPTFTDKGRRIQAICALGKQDFDVETCRPVEEGLVILGASSDHLMVDVTAGKRPYQVGGVLELELGYFSTMRAFTSPYVGRDYLE